MFIKTDSSKWEKRIKELEIEWESFDREVEALFAKLGFSKEELSSFLQEENNFSKEGWKLIQTHLSSLQKREMKEDKKDIGKEPPSSHWLFVK